MSFSHVNSVSAQWWCGINVKETCFILFLPNGDIEWNLKVLIIIFSDKVLHVALLEGTKENELSTCDSERKKTIAWESVFSLKNGLKGKVLMDIDPRRVDKAIRVHYEKCLLCTLYQEKLILSSFKVVICHAWLFWPTSY